MKKKKKEKLKFVGFSVNVIVTLESIANVPSKHDDPIRKFLTSRHLVSGKRIYLYGRPSNTVIVAHV